MEEAAADKAKVREASDTLLGVANGLKAQLSTLSQRNDLVVDLAERTVTTLERVHEILADTDLSALKLIREDIIPLMTRFETDQLSMRVVLLRKTDDLQGSVDLLRSDVATNFQSAQFALSNSRNGREDVNQLIDLVTQLQRSQSLLSSQVEELRKAEQERAAERLGKPD